MDAGLFDASQKGDIQLLHQLLAENPLLLHSLALTSTKNPLHVASIAGHVDFVKEIVRLKPDFVEEMNEDGFSPMHIASANGYLEIVREMLRVDRRLCRLNGRDEWTPLHYAASRGRVEVIREMVLACPESVEDVTVQGETVIHLAVKCSQFKAIKFLVEYLVGETNEVNILNMKDTHGNSVLHLGTWKKQHQVVKGLVGNEIIAAALEVNSVNDRGLTALDLVFPNETGDWEMEAILRGAGALRAVDIVHSGVPSFSSDGHNHTHTASETHHLQQQREQQKPSRWEYFQFKRGRDPPSDARTALLVVASLVATATFQVGISPPNGIWQDSSDLNNNGTVISIEPLHLAGMSIMCSYSEVSFVIFVVLNSIGFYVSLYMIIVLTTNFPLQLELQICTSAVYFTYSYAVISIIPSFNICIFIYVFTVVLPFLVGLACKWARHPVVIRLTKPLGKWISRFFELFR